MISTTLPSIRDLRMHLPSTLFLRTIAILTAASSLGCSTLTSDSRSSPCGRNQHADASVTLPDTGINARRTILVSFIQHDPDLAGELSEFAIQQVWPNGAAADSEPDPRVRLVGSSGQVFVDSLGSRYDQPTNKFSDPTWHVYGWIRDAQVRNALYAAFATESLWLELWHAGASKPGTRVLLMTKDYGVYPPAICL